MQSLYMYLFHILFSFPVVTGGSEGIGLAYAKELAKRHMNIILLSRSPDKLKKAANEIGICCIIFTVIM